MPQGVKLHIQRTPECKKIFNQQLQSASTSNINFSPVLASPAADHESADYMAEPSEDFAYHPPQCSRAEYVSEDHPLKRTHMEEVDDEDAPGAPGQIPKAYHRVAGDVSGFGKTSFEEIQEKREKMGHGSNPWAPFENLDEWGLAEWLARSVNRTATDKFLKLSIVSSL